ncbi:hypothetical protein J8655_08125 [Dickeya oryzae]|uniref:hypothetical protein n=1 Tax=Dickeya oryzae TaxID=1240404 RepID=UPI001AECF024|nr:hypothetical protein [Dickeya oryzae]MBP2845441.1 hypothetical protein [Dickeya oryzae]
MKKIACLSIVMAMLSGCSNHGRVDDGPLRLNAAYSSEYYLPQSISTLIADSRVLSETLVLAVDPKRIDDIRDTYRASRPKITVNYNVSPVDESKYRITYSGTINYLSSLNIHTYNGRTTIGGHAIQNVNIPTRTAELPYGKNVEFALDDNVKLNLSVEKETK